MDERNWTNWDDMCPHKEDSTNNPYYNQPTHSPYRSQGFAIACMAFGILSMMSTCLAFVPFVLASFSLLFASLSYRRGRRRSQFTFYGVFASCFGIISAIIMLTQTFSMVFGGEAASYQQYLQQYLEQMR